MQKAGSQVLDSICISEAEKQAVLSLIREEVHTAVCSSRSEPNRFLTRSDSWESALKQCLLSGPYKGGRNQRLEEKVWAGQTTSGRDEVRKTCCCTLLLCCQPDQQGVVMWGLNQEKKFIFQRQTLFEVFYYFKSFKWNNCCFWLQKDCCRVWDNDCSDDWWVSLCEGSWDVCVVLMGGWGKGWVFILMCVFVFIFYLCMRSAFDKYSLIWVESYLVVTGKLTSQFDACVSICWKTCCFNRSCLNCSVMHRSCWKPAIFMQRLKDFAWLTVLFYSEDDQRRTLSSQKALHAVTLEKEAALADLNSVERSLSDVFRRYENTKSNLEGFKKVGHWI